MIKMRIAYTAGPYRAPDLSGVLRNIHVAKRVAIQLWKWGYAVVCPHMNSMMFPEGAADYIGGDLEMLDRMTNQDIMVMLPGWERSEGAQKERIAAIDRYMMIFHWPVDSVLIRKYAYIGHITDSVEQLREVYDATTNSASIPK